MTSRRSIREAGGSGYTTAFTHPDPLDPNDVQRQKTQSRAGSFPYDRPTSYGGPIGTDLGGAAYQRAPDATPPKPQHRSARSKMPYGQYGAAWEQLESMLGTYTPGEQADDAFALGYGSHGRMGEDGLDPMSLQKMFMPEVPTDEVTDSVLGLLSLLSADSDGECPADDSYEDDWDERVYAPGAEDDPV